jgi:hypothetical protein
MRASFVKLSRAFFRWFYLSEGGGMVLTWDAFWVLLVGGIDLNLLLLLLGWLVCYFFDCFSCLNGSETLPLFPFRLFFSPKRHRQNFTSTISDYFPPNQLINTNQYKKPIKLLQYKHTGILLVFH